MGLFVDGTYRHIEPVLFKSEQTRPQCGRRSISSTEQLCVASSKHVSRDGMVRTYLSIVGCCLIQQRPLLFVLLIRSSLFPRFNVYSTISVAPCRFPCFFPSLNDCCVHFTLTELCIVLLYLCSRLKHLILC